MISRPKSEMRGSSLRHCELLNWRDAQIGRKRYCVGLYGGERIFARAHIRIIGCCALCGSGWPWKLDVQSPRFTRGCDVVLVHAMNMGQGLWQMQVIAEMANDAFEPSACISGYAIKGG